MNDEKFEKILFQLQEQNKELLTAVMNLQVSNNLLKEQLANDLHKVYEEIYNPKEGDDLQEFLKSKKFIVNELNDMTAKETDKIVTKFGEDMEAMEENLKSIFS